MPHSLTLITTITVSLVLALLFGLLANRVRMPALVGYLLAGIVIGPATPGFVANMELSTQLAEIGVILLMFGVGLHFSLKDLLSVRNIALPGALVQIATATLLGFLVAQSWGWSMAAGLVFGLSLSVASTVVLLKALEQSGALRTINGRIAVGWLIVEDLVMVLVLVLLPVSAAMINGQSSAQEQNLYQTLALTLAQVTLFAVLMMQVGKRVFPWLLTYVANSGSRELFTLTVIAAAMGIAFGAAKLFGVSFALGAFFAGMVMRESHLSHRAAQESLPLRDAFSVLFFVSVGMLFDPMVLVNEPLHVLMTVAIIILGKSLAAFVLVLAFRYPLNTALTVSVSLAQIGEFSFILAGMGLSLGLLPQEGLNLVLAGSLLSIAINPLVFSSIEPIQKWVRSRSFLARALERSADPLSELPATVSSDYVTGHLILAGYGRIGKAVFKRLQRHSIATVIAEQNRETVERLRNKGQHAVAGDISDPAVLIQAHVVRARVLVITLPETPELKNIIHIARQLNPEITILVHCHNAREADSLRDDKTIRPFVSDLELSHNMAEAVVNSYRS